MRSAFTLIIFFLVVSTANAQSRQQQKVDSVFQKVKIYFNQKNADAIYNFAGSDFQKELSIDAFNDVANKQLFPLGEIKGSTLISFVNNNVATYKLNFSTVTLQLLMSLDKKDKLELFLFQDYKEPIANKTALVATTNTRRSSIEIKIDSVVRTYIQKSNTVGLCIGILNKGKVSVFGYGETIKRTGKIPNADNFFEIGSITKTFTATLLAWYVNEGKIKLEDPVTKFLPDSVSANPELAKITLLNLINHTSGLARIPDNLISHASDPLNPYKDYTKTLLFQYLKYCKLENKPGEKYAYSNLGVGLLGTILENVSARSYGQMLNEVICKPLNMFSTAQYLNPLLAPRFVQVYNSDGDETPAWDFDVLAPCGALRSTVNDLLIYVKANMYPGTDQLSKAFLLTQKVTFARDVKIALAWHIITVNGLNYFFHNGGTNGSSSFLAFNPDKQLAIVVLSNAAESTDKVGTDILKVIQ